MRFLTILALCLSSLAFAERGPTLEEGKVAPTPKNPAPAAPAKLPPAAPPVTTTTLDPRPVTAPVVPREAGIQDATKVPVLDLFQVDQLPGSGSINANFGEKKDSVALGSASGYYGVGVFFQGKRLPPPAGNELKDQWLLQLSFGALRNRLQGQVPQFLALSLALSAIPTVEVGIPVAEPGNSQDSGKDRGYLLYNSPQTPNDRSDEEKLKSAYFGQGGTVRLRPLGGERVVDGKASGKRYSFRMRMYEVILEGRVLTPFSAATGTLSAKVVVPVYRPNGPSAEELLARLATESFESSLTGQAGSRVPAKEND